MWGMSRPRAERDIFIFYCCKYVNSCSKCTKQSKCFIPATSVATMTGTSCFLNAFITLFLSSWCISPWIKATATGHKKILPSFISSNDLYSVHSVIPPWLQINPTLTQFIISSHNQSMKPVRTVQTYGCIKHSPLKSLAFKFVASSSLFAFLVTNIKTLPSGR